MLNAVLYFSLSYSWCHFSFKMATHFIKVTNVDIMFVLMAFYIWIIPSGVFLSSTFLVLVSHSHPISPVKDLHMLSFQSSTFWFYLLFVFVLPFEETGISFLSCLALSSAYCGISFSLLFLVPFCGSWGHCLRLDSFTRSALSIPL